MNRKGLNDMSGVVHIVLIIVIAIIVVLLILCVLHAGLGLDRHHQSGTPLSGLALTRVLFDLQIRSNINFTDSSLLSYNEHRCLP